jgi:hypothetical protein
MNVILSRDAGAATTFAPATARQEHDTSTCIFPLTMNWSDVPGKGSHTYKVRFKSGFGNTVSIEGYRLELTIF